MNIVKLSATDSTNSYLKALTKRKKVENWTVVTAEEQTNGKGQFDNSWLSEKGKNLTFSILVWFDKLKTNQQFYLNYCVSLAIVNVLNYYIPGKLAVKWPNDILSARKKICGILIECFLKNSSVNYAILGIGLNVNQVDFPEVFNATSIKLQLQKDIDRDELLEKILLEIQYQFLALQRQDFTSIKHSYERILYKKGIPSMFINKFNQPFLGKILGISTEGKLQVELDNEQVKEFDLKEIKFT